MLIWAQNMSQMIVSHDKRIIGKWMAILVIIIRLTILVSNIFDNIYEYYLNIKYKQF